MKIKDILAISEDKNSLGNRFRNKRFNFFTKKILNLTKPLKILDVGGVENYWVNRNFHGDVNFQILLVNLKKQHTSFSNIRSIEGNAIDMSNFRDKEFDIVFL